MLSCMNWVHMNRPSKQQQHAFAAATWCWCRVEVPAIRCPLSVANRQCQHKHASKVDVNRMGSGDVSTAVMEALLVVHIQVLRTLPMGPQLDLEACLDWLCLNLPQSELPKRFAGVARAGIGNAAGVKVGACCGVHATVARALTMWHHGIQLQRVQQSHAAAAFDAQHQPVTIWAQLLDARAESFIDGLHSA